MIFYTADKCARHVSIESLLSIIHDVTEECICGTYCVIHYDVKCLIFSAKDGSQYAANYFYMT